MMNMYAMYWYGMWAQMRLKPWQFILLIFSSSIFGYILMFVWHRSILAVGLSCAIYGIIGLQVMELFYNHFWNSRELRSYFIRALMFTLLFNMIPGIGWAGHLGGFFMGIMWGFVLINPKHGIPAMIMLWGAIAFAMYQAIV